MNIYEKKIKPCYFIAIIDGEKPFEIRREDDFFAFAGDLLLLREFSEYDNRYTGRECLVEITYIYRGHPLPDGYAVFGIRLLRGRR